MNMRFDDQIFYWAHMLDECRLDKDGRPADAHAKQVQAHADALSFDSHRIPFSTGGKQDLLAILDFGEPVDMVNEYRVFQGPDFARPEKPQAVLETVPGMLKASLGKNVECAAEGPLSVYADGLAAANLEESNELLDLIGGLEAAVNGLPDYKTAREKAEADAQARGEIEYTGFDMNQRRMGKAAARFGDKIGKAGHEQEIRAGDLRRSKQIKGGVQRAVADLDKTRKGAVLKSGIGAAAAKLLANGSLIQPYVDLPGRPASGDQTTIYWYPTLLDLARILPDDARVPAQFVRNVNRLDSSWQAMMEKPWFSGDQIFESFESVVDGKTAWRDVMTSTHYDYGQGVRDIFCKSKSSRWQEFKKMAPDRDLGEIFCKITDIRQKDKKGGDRRLQAVVMKNGICLLYKQHDEFGKKPITTMFLMPEFLVKLMYGEDKTRQPVVAPADLNQSLPVWMLKTCIRNVPRITQDDYIMIRTQGTRRYIK